MKTVFGKKDDLNIFSDRHFFNMVALSVFFFMKLSKFTIMILESNILSLLWSITIKK